MEEDPFLQLTKSQEGLSTKNLARCMPAIAENTETLDIHFIGSSLEMELLETG